MTSVVNGSNDGGGACGIFSGLAHRETKTWFAARRGRWGKLETRKQKLEMGDFGLGRSEDV